MLNRLVRPLLFALLSALPCHAWDYEGHRMVNQLALASLPTNFPSFVRAPAAAERIAYLGGAPDRWRNTPDLPVKHATSPDHYFDLEYITLAGLKPSTLSDLRYVFALQFSVGRNAHAAAFPSIDAEKNADRTQEWPGFLPWAIAENAGRLKSAFSCLAVYRELGTADEVANAEADVIQAMGILSHYVGDSAQPLHITMHHNGWVGENPRGYSRWSGLHQWIDGGFIAKAGIGITNLLPRVTPANAWALPAPAAGAPDPLFAAILAHVVAQHAQVEPLYKLEQAGVFKAETAATSKEGRAFIEDRLLTGGRALGDLWVTCWKHAGPDVYLRTRLLQRSDRGARD
jgi:hypothetical protein